jgi:hypothetical protein
MSQRGPLVATHARDLDRANKPPRTLVPATAKPRPREAILGELRSPLVDSPPGSDQLCRRHVSVQEWHKRREVQLAIVGDVSEITGGGDVISTHPIRHDRAREQGRARTRRQTRWRQRGLTTHSGGTRGPEVNRNRGTELDTSA